MVLLRALFGFVVAVFAAGLLLTEAALARPDARGARTVIAASWVEEWDPAAQRWVRVEDGSAALASPKQGAATITTSRRAEGVTVTETITAITTNTTAQFGFVRPMAPTARSNQQLAQYGPFRVLDETRAALIGATDVASPRQFDAMLRNFPGLAVIEMVDAPGTSHDLANLALGRKIRAAGLETHVPHRGSVRSGAVELFLAGKRQTIAPGATFAVHSWLDSRGFEPRHFADDAPENRLYLDYYAEMGMAPDHALAFYAMTNSVPHSSALWLDAATMQQWIDPMAQPALATEPEPALGGPMIWAGVASEIETPIEAAKPILALHHEGMTIAAQSVWQAMMQSGLHFAGMAQKPAIAYADFGAITLARLDSSMVFP